MLGDDARKDVFAKVMAGLGVFRVGKKDRNHQLRIENINAHRGIAVARVVRELFGRSGLFLKADDAPVLVHFEDAELARRLRDRNLNRGHGDVGGRIGVLLKHLGVVHLVDVIAGEDEHEFGTFASDRIDVLIDGVGGALIPLLGDTHLRRNHFDVFAEAGKRRPGGANVAIQAESLVLGKDEDAAEVRIDAIGQCDVNDAVERAERNGGLGAVTGQRPKTLPLPPGKKYADGIPHRSFGHGPAPRTLNGEARTF